MKTKILENGDLQISLNPKTQLNFKVLLKDKDEDLETWAELCETWLGWDYQGNNFQWDEKAKVIRADRRAWIYNGIPQKELLSKGVVIFTRIS